MKVTRSVLAMMIAFLSATAVVLAGVKQQWPPARMLVWAKPGTSGTAMTAGNWMEFASAADYAAGKTGKPAAKMPDANTDIILPDAPEGQSYVVGCMVSSKDRKKRKSGWYSLDVLLESVEDARIIFGFNPLGA